MSISKQKIVGNLHSNAFISVPYSSGSKLEVVSGLFLSPNEANKVVTREAIYDGLSDNFMGKLLSASFITIKMNILSSNCLVNGDKGSGQSHDIAVKGKYSINEEEAAKIIENIRREEFGLDSAFSAMEESILKKQNARLGKAQHPLCDVGNSTKKERSAGYIGKKGIGFKSVFRVIDAPEIHSNGFHIKFDISEGEIGFVLPTNVRLLLLICLARWFLCTFRNLLDASLIVVRKEAIGNVSTGKDKINMVC
ncbi:histidine kinase-, DNA gyrase B-, and HSP90-like ATPase family protein [Tanacetum coccineum]|uniref:Histidine kinase-, DNA gyrase B-, and HSP90-like ATPase family protein n=1 Tax=Tanacetum coccineum TaxID=301880 RepID=A0ABQ4ZTC1_9ASTR